MLLNYYNSAILTVREYINGVDKLDRLQGETMNDTNKRRKQRLNNRDKRR